METQSDARIVAAELLNDGLVVKFEDGSCVFYSALLLRETAAQAETLDETEVAW